MRRHRISGDGLREVKSVSCNLSARKETYHYQPRENGPLAVARLKRAKSSSAGPDPTERRVLKISVTPATRSLEEIVCSESL